MVIILLSLNGCKPWQYMIVNSSRLTRNDRNQLVFENDTLRLTYDIAGNGGQVAIHIFNKTSQPLAINWQRSAFVRNRHSTSFLNKDVVVHGHSVNTYRYTRNFIASFALPDSAGFIPPGAEIVNDLPDLAATGPMEIDLSDTIPKQKLAERNGVNYVKFKQRVYDEANSPIRFSVYLTFSIGQENRQFSLTNNFYVSNVYIADGGPEDFSLYHGGGDMIYIRLRASGGPPESQPTASSSIR